MLKTGLLNKGSPSQDPRKIKNILIFVVLKFLSYTLCFFKNIHLDLYLEYKAYTLNDFYYII